MLDYAHALEESVTRLFLALVRKAQDRNLPPLGLLLLERQASAGEGWFHRLLESENSTGGGPVGELFEPPEPVSLHPLDTPELRRAVLADTLQLAAQHDGRPSPSLPAAGTNAAFDGRLQEAQWSDPLYLMMAALVGRERVAGIANPSRGEFDNQLLEALSLGRTDLAMEVAKHELRRLDLFLPDPSEAAKNLLRHLAACATLCGGFTAEQALAAAEEEALALGLVWPAASVGRSPAPTTACPPCSPTSWPRPWCWRRSAMRD